MYITGFTYVRNGIRFGFPFLATIKSLLPLVEELVVVVGDSDDGTREAIAALNEPKIRIIDTQWDEQLRQGGRILAQQANIGIKAMKGKWILHLQADEVLHENEYENLLKAIEEADKRPEVDGLLFHYYHFWGDYRYIRTSRKAYRYEVRAFKNRGVIRAYKDAQGFRKYPSETAYEQGHRGEKLKVLLANVHVYHYSYCRNPRLLQKKVNDFHRWWHSDQWIQKHRLKKPFDFNQVDKLSLFQGTHPKYMQPYIAAKDWEFHYDPSKSTMKWKDRLLHWIEEKTGKRLFEYKNYILLK